MAATLHLSRAQIMRAIVMMSLVLLTLRQDGREAQDNEKRVESSSGAKEKEDSAEEKECYAAAGAAPGSCAADEEGAEKEGNASEIGVRKRKYVKLGWREWAELGCWDRIQLLGSEMNAAILAITTEKKHQFKLVEWQSGSVPIRRRQSACGCSMENSQSLAATPRLICLLSSNE